MIIEKQGNLLYQNCDIMIHQANCFATMGAGIAAQLKAKYPEVLVADKMFHIPIGSSKRLGEFSKCETRSNQVIYNLYGQYNYGRGKQTDYPAFMSSLKKIFRDINKSGLNNKKIGMPYLIGCGLAGGDWKIVKRIIEVEALKANLTVHIFKL